LGTYNGRFQVVNLTGGDISNVTIGHNKEAWATLGTLPNGTLGDPTPFQAETGVDDDWSVSFTNASGQSWSRNGKQCNYEEEDQGLTLLIIFYAQNFTLLTPQSDPCLNNYYS
jgi:hypothetical protein